MKGLTDLPIYTTPFISGPYGPTKCHFTKYGKCIQNFAYITYIEETCKTVIFFLN